MNRPELVRGLGLKESMALVIGTVIGTGVFLKSGIMAQTVGTPLSVLAAWVAAGVLSLIGALCYSELGSLFPRAGGEYVYLREAYGNLMAFLYGWMRFWIGTPGSIAAYGVGAATFLNGVFDLGGNRSESIVAIGFILVFSVLNCFTVKTSGKIQSFITALKILIVVGLTLAVFSASALSGGASWSHLTSGEGLTFRGYSSFGAAMLAALWAYDGWNNMPMAAGEIRDPRKNIPRALIIGMLLVCLVYAFANLAYFYALPFGEILTARSKLNPTGLPVAAKAAQLALGPMALSALSIAFIISALGAMNGSILTGARVPYAMARDGLFFKTLGRLSKNSHSPVISVLVQGVIASALALSNSFDQLTDYVVFSSWIFYALVTASIFIFRKRMVNDLNSAQSYRAPGYPILPAFFIVASLILLANTVATEPQNCLFGLAFLIFGIPVYFAMRRLGKGEAAP